MRHTKNKEICFKPPTGFLYYPDFISFDEEKEIIHEIEKLDWQEVKMHGIVAKRSVVHFGVNYIYTSRTVAKTKSPPAFLHPVISRIARLIKIKKNEIAEILITKYPIGAGIGWHKDASIFGNKIFGLSLNSSCELKFRIAKNDSYQIWKTKLLPCSGYLISGEARDEWQHSILPVKKLRYSITFRTLIENTLE